MAGPSQNSTHQQMKADQMSCKYTEKQTIDNFELKSKWKQIDWLKNDLNSTAIGRGDLYFPSPKTQHNICGN